MELVLKTSGQKCLVGSNPTASAKTGLRARFLYNPFEMTAFSRKRAKTVNAYNLVVRRQWLRYRNFVIKLKPLTVLYSHWFTYG